MNEIRVSVGNVLRPVLAIGMVVMTALACDTGSGGSSSKKDPEPALTVTAIEIDKHAASDLRNSYGLFSITANEDVADYYLAVKETGEGAPTAAEMTAHGLKRKLSTTAITVLIAQRMDAPMIAFAKTYFGDAGHTTLGTGMSGDLRGISGVAFDGADAAGTWTKAARPWVEESVLKPQTDYTLYGMSDDTVENLLEFSTDASPTSWRTTETAAVRVDTTLGSTAGAGLTMTLNSDEYYIIPIQIRTPNGSSPQYHDLFFSLRVSGNNVTEMSPQPSLLTVPDAGYTYQIGLFPYQDPVEETAHNSFVLIDTSRIRKNGSSSLEWGASISTYAGATTSIYKLEFTIQD